MMVTRYINEVLTSTNIYITGIGLINVVISSKLLNTLILPDAGFSVNRLIKLFIGYTVPHQIYALGGATWLYI